MKAILALIPCLLGATAQAQSPEWSGPYLGASLGYGEVDILLEDPVELNGEGVLGGVHAGYLHDAGRIVVGGELDLALAEVDFDFSDAFLDEGGLPDDTGLSLDELHAFKLRLGYDAGEALLYGVIGAAHGRLSIRGVGAEEEVSETGYLFGAGADLRLTDRVRLGTEVLYQGFEGVETLETDLDVTTVRLRVSAAF